MRAVSVSPAQEGRAGASLVLVRVLVPSNSVFLTSDNKKANCDQLSVVGL